MKLLKTKSDGTDIIINLDNVTCIVPEHDSNDTTVYFLDKTDRVTVDISFENICELLQSYETDILFI